MNMVDNLKAPRFCSIDVKDSNAQLIVLNLPDIMIAFDYSVHLKHSDSSFTCMRKMELNNFFLPIECFENHHSWPQSSTSDPWLIETIQLLMEGKSFLILQTLLRYRKFVGVLRQLATSWWFMLTILSLISRVAYESKSLFNIKCSLWLYKIGICMSVRNSIFFLFIWISAAWRWK